MRAAAAGLERVELPEAELGAHARGDVRARERVERGEQLGPRRVVFRSASPHGTRLKVMNFVNEFCLFGASCEDHVLKKGNSQSAHPVQ